MKATPNATFLMLKSRPPNLEETKEADMIIYNRIDELRDEGQCSRAKNSQNHINGMCSAVGFTKVNVSSIV
jgi:hypothetical protein